MMITEQALKSAYQRCQQLAQSHYENFPVASFLLPKSLRQPISVIYAFARTADDFADEGDSPVSMRLAQLDTYTASLEQIEAGAYRGQDFIFIALQDVIHRYQLPVSLFHDLLTAFKQDVVKDRYASFNEVLDYCRFSANPVGRLLLHLQGATTAQQLIQSDAICTALQLINFYQDVRQDYMEQNRVYIPLDELHAADLAEADLIGPDTAKLAPVLRSLYRRAAMLMQQGYPLGLSLSGRLGWEVRAMTLGGIQILSRLIAQSDQQLITRPRHQRRQMIAVLAGSLLGGTYVYQCKKHLKLR